MKSNPCGKTFVTSGQFLVRGTLVFCVIALHLSKTLAQSSSSSASTPSGPPVLRGDRPTLRNDLSKSGLYSTRVVPAPLQQGPQTDQSLGTDPSQQKSGGVKPLVDTEPKDPSEVTPTATIDSIFHMKSGLRLLETTDLSNGVPNSASASSTPSSLVAPNTGNGRIYEPGFKIGLFEIRPGASVSTVYDDNILLAPKNTSRYRSDWIYNISPTVELAYTPEGDTDVGNIDFTYTPSAQFFQNYSEQNNINQSLDLSTGYQFSKLSLGFKQTLYTLTGGDPASGERVQRTLFDTTVFANYDLGEKTSVELTTVLSGRSVDTATSFNTLSPNTQLFVNYEYLPKLKLGVGIGGAYIQVDNAPDQSSITPSVRALYDYSDKTKFFLQTGIDWHDYGSNVSKSINVNFSAGGTYEVNPLLNTSLSANRSQSVSNTLLGIDTINTGFSLGANYTVFKEFHITGNLGYENVEYIAAISGQGNKRVDDYYYINPGVTYSPQEYWDITLSYLHRENASTSSALSFENNQFTIQNTLRF